MNPAPMIFQWTQDGAMRPLGRFASRCANEFSAGELYTLVPHEMRSIASHSHYFASLQEAFLNLPERYAARFPTSEHLRKWALIKAHYADERSIACSTPEEALKIAAFIKPMDDYAVVVVSDATIKVFTAKSQSTRAMGKKEFQESKQAVLDIVAEMIGVDASTLSANTQGDQVRASALPHSSVASRPPAHPQAAAKPASAAEGEEPTKSGAGTYSRSSALADGTAPRAGENRQVGSREASRLNDGVTDLPERGAA